MAGTADNAQDTATFRRDKAQELFARVCEGKHEYYQRLRAQRGIPDGYCAVCGEKPVREGRETCSTKCAQASESESCLYASQMAAYTY